MKINYQILWIEDDLSWYDTVLELFKNTLEEDGFELISERKSNINEIKAMVDNNGLQKYDMLLVDFTLKNSDSGDEIIKYIRGHDIFTDVLLYSSDIQNVTESMHKYGLEGVYTADRKEIETKFEAVFKTTIKKIQEVNAIRGLIVGETTELDVEIGKLILLLIKQQEKSEDELKSIIKEKVFDKLESKAKSFWEKYDNFDNYFHKIEALIKWEILRDLLKPLKTRQEIADFLEKNRTYQTEVISIRNQFAHAKAEENGSKWFLKGQLGKEDFEFDETKCIEIRKKLIAHRNNIAALKAILSQ
jgi:hypothetical protein